MVHDLLEGTPQSIGRKSRAMPLPEIFRTFPQIYSYVITGLSSQLGRTLVSRLQKSAALSSFGAELDLGNRVVLGKKPGIWRTLKILARSSGADTEIKSILSSMSLEAVLTSRTCCDGLIDIRSQWRSKVPANHYLQRSIGLQAMSTPRTGIQNWMAQHSTPYRED